MLNFSIKFFKFKKVYSPRLSWYRYSTFLNLRFNSFTASKKWSLLIIDYFNLMPIENKMNLSLTSLFFYSSSWWDIEIVFILLGVETVVVILVVRGVVLAVIFYFVSKSFLIWTLFNLILNLLISFYFTFFNYLLLLEPLVSILSVNLEFLFKKRADTLPLLFYIGNFADYFLLRDSLNSGYWICLREHFLFKGKLWYKMD
jgi:hypothetical protein